MISISQGEKTKGQTEPHNNPLEPNNILNPIRINVEKDSSTDLQRDDPEMHDSRNIPFSEDFIKEELERHNLNPHFCANCSDAVKHFVDPKILADKIYAKNIKWLKNPESNLDKRDHYPNLELPVWDPENIGTDYPVDRPRGIIQIKRLASRIEDRGDFIKIAKASSANILKKLRNLPYSAAEINHKIEQDVKNHALVSLREFLSKDEVIKLGINTKNVLNHLTASALLLAYNPASSNTKVRLCVNPARYLLIVECKLNLFQYQCNNYD